MGATCCSVVSYILAVVLIAGGACLYELLPPYVHKMLKEDLAVTSPTDSSFDSFANSSSKTSIYQSFYVFHCNNPYAVVYDGAIPNITQRGPYNYLTTQWNTLEDIVWYANATIGYTYHETYAFEAGLSGNLRDTDVITTLNLGFIGALYEKRAAPLDVDLLRDIAAANKDNIFVNITVQELMFGYNNSFLQSISWLPDAPSPFVSLFTNDDPSSFANGLTVMYSGGQAANGLPVPPPNSLGQLTQWEGMRSLPYWGDEYANMINGTDGTRLPPGVTSADTPYVFVDTLFRSCTLTYDSAQTYEGVDLLRFVLSPDTLKNSTANPNNAPFGMNQTGFLPTPPAGNKPVTFSKPHFLDADISGIQLVMSPPLGDTENYRDLYETFLDTEPLSGLLFRVHKRIQLNTFLEPAYYTNNPNQVSTWYPILWADENMELPSHLVDEFKNEVELPLHIAKYGGIAAMSLGGVLFVVGTVMVVLALRKPSSHHITHPSDLVSQRLNTEY